MSDIIRWDPFKEMRSFRDTMDRFFERPFTGVQPAWMSAWDLSLDVVESDDAFVVTASVPGIEPDDLEITFDNRVLTIRGETRADTETERGRFHLRERRYGKFSRRLSLPPTVDDDAIEASYKAGVLTLRLPKTEAAKPKRIPVQAEGSVIIER